MTHTGNISALRITLFGHFTVSGGDEIAIQKLQRRSRAQSLLAYLILSEGDLPRARIASELWPESPQARTNLRRELHLLTTEFPEYTKHLEVSPELVLWKLPATCSVDVLDFRKTYQEFENKQRKTDKIALARQLSKLYVAPLLSFTHDAWLEQPRKQFTEQWQKVAEYISNYFMAENDYANALKLARKRLQLNALDEAAIYQVVASLAMQDKLADAKSEYEQFCILYKEEVGINPELTFNMLIKDVRTTSDQFRPNFGQPKTPVNKKGSLAVEGLCVGRSEQLQSIDDLINSADSLMVVITGEAGIGKTCLVEKYTERSDALVARCVNAETKTPFSVFADWFKAPEFSQSVDQLPKHHQAELTRVFPDCFPAGSDFVTEHSVRGQSLLFDACTDLIGHTSALLIIDDLQWCDKDSLALIHHISATSSSSIKILSTLRTEEISLSNYLADCLNRMELRDQIHSIALDRLNEISSVELLQRLSTVNRLDSLDLETQNRIVEWSQGNPLFLSEMIRYLAETGQESILPRKIHALLRQRLATLSEDALNVCRTAAYCGIEIPLDLISTASGVNPELAVAVIEELTDRFVLREVKDCQFEFTHECIRESIKKSTSSARARFIHQKLALAYQAIYKDSLHSRAGTIADHYQCAGLMNEAMQWYEQAMAVAEERLAFQECLTLYEKASLHLQDQPNVAADLQARLLLRQASAYAVLYGFASTSVRDVCAEIKHLYSEINSTDLKLDILNRLRMLASFSGDSHSALHYAKQSVDESDPDISPSKGIEALRSLAFTQYQSGRVAKAHTSLKQAVSIGTKCLASKRLDKDEMPWSYIMSVYMKAHVGSSRGMYNESVKEINYAGTFAANHIPAHTRTFLYLGRAIGLYNNRMQQDMASAVAPLNDINANYHVPKAGIFADAFDGWSQQSPHQGIEQIQKAIDQYNYVIEDHFGPFWKLLLAERELDANLPERALVTCREGLAEANRINTPFLVPELIRLEGKALAADDPGLAITAFNKAADIARSQGNRMSYLRTLTSKIKILSDPNRLISCEQVTMKPTMHWRR